MAVFLIIFIASSLSKNIQAQTLTDPVLASQIIHQGNQLYFACLSQAKQINNALANNRPFPNVPKEFISDKDVKYLLYTQKNPSTPQTLMISDSSETIANSNYDSSKRTILYIPGLSDASSNSASQLPWRILPKMDVNLIITNWDSYAFFDGTYTVNRTVPLLANIGAKFIRKLFNQGATPDRMFFIGYSSGGQVVGLMGKQLRRIEKILAVDPAAPCYTYQPSRKKLTYSDAEKVEILHCSGGILGVPPFYTVKKDHFLGYQGIFQPQCRSSGSAFQVGICSHVMCVSIFYQNVEKYVIKGQ